MGTDVQGQHLFDILFDIPYCTDKELHSKHARAKLVLHGSSTSSTPVPCIQFCFIILALKMWVLKSEYCDSQ